MAPGGFLCFYDFTDVTPALFWGLSAQCWGFQDERDFSLWCSLPRWERLLANAGFEQVRTLRPSPEHQGICLDQASLPPCDMPLCCC